MEQDIEKLPILFTQVAEMQKELEELQPQLVTTAAENEKMMIVCFTLTH